MNNFVPNAHNKPVMELLCILMSMFLLMFIVMGVTQTVLKSLNLSEHNSLIIGSALQGILVFALPSIITAYFESKSPLKLLGVKNGISIRGIIGIFIIFIIGYLFLNLIINYNENVTLPTSMHSIESKLKEFEESSAKITEILLSGNSVWDLIIEVIVIGCITGLCEELFFRAGLQRILGYAMPKHISIWTTAVIFSVMHMQFYGLVPRILLGAFFGYLYYWTGSLWTPVISHVLNNSCVVIVKWIENRFGEISILSNYNNLVEDFPIWGFISGVLTIIILVKWHNFLFSRNNSKI